MSKQFFLVFGPQETALPNDLPLRGSEIHVCAWIQSGSEASLGHVGEGEKERKGQLSEHKVQSHSYRRESGLKDSPTTGLSELAGVGIS